MQIKICGIQNEDELQNAIKAGANAVGFLVGQVHRSKNFILASTAGRLAEQLPPFITPVIVTHLTTAEDIEQIMTRANIYTVQLHGVSNEEIFKLRDMLPVHAKIIVSEYMKNPQDLLNLDEIYAVIDAINLDCYNDEVNSIGEKNQNNSYSWQEAAEFARQCSMPVIVSGGLSAENIAEAVKQIMPYGVDACSRLKDEETENCDKNKCVNYVKNAQLALLNETI